MTKRTKQSEKISVPVTTPYIPSAQERAAIDRVLERQGRKGPTPRFKKIDSGPDNVVQVLADHPDLNISKTLVADVLGTGNQEFSTGLLAQLMTLTRSGKIASEEEVNFILSVLRGIDPKDETEALLAAQMVAIHNATMIAARRDVDREYSAAGQRLEHAEQARPDFRGSGRSPQEIPLCR